MFYAAFMCAQTLHLITVQRFVITLEGKRYALLLMSCCGCDTANKQDMARLPPR
jgi:hypothetical protein